MKRIIKEYDLDLSIFEENQKRLKNKILQPTNDSTNFLDKLTTNSTMDSNKIKKKLFKLEMKEKKCEICGISEWNNQEITLQIHHINGKRTDNELSNLQILCPNCHSQTDNFCTKQKKETFYCKNCGKEIKKNKSGLCIDCIKMMSIQKFKPIETNKQKNKIYNLTKEEFQELLDKSSSYEELRKYLNLNCKNETIKHAIITYDLDISTFENNKKNKNIDKMLVKDSQIRNEDLKKKLFELGIKEKKCEICGITDWNNQPMSLQLHHINGIILIMSYLICKFFVQIVTLKLIIFVIKILNILS